MHRSTKPEAIETGTEEAVETTPVSEFNVAGKRPLFQTVIVVAAGLVMTAYLCIQLLLISNTIEGRIMAVQVPPLLGAAGTPIGSDFPHTGLYKLGPRVPILTYVFKVNGVRGDIRDSAVLKTSQLELLPQADMIQVRYVPAMATMWHRPVLPNENFVGFVAIIGCLTLTIDVVAGWMVLKLLGYRKGEATVV